MADDDDTYTEPDLRRRLKDEIKASDRGGKAGEWSARTSQLLAQEYERQDDGSKGEQDERQKSLETWSDEDWQTAGGEADAREGDTTERDLPREVWDRLSQKERRKAIQSKKDGSKGGEQHATRKSADKQAMNEGGAKHHEPIEE